MNKLEKEKVAKGRGTDANRDPITDTPGAHPVGTGMGATAGGLAGAAIGAIGGPIGAAVGIAAGAAIGGLAGKGVAEKIDPTVEDTYWRTNYSTRPYVDPAIPYDAYAPAYRTGYEGYGRYAGRKFDEVEPDLRNEYDRIRDRNSRLDWPKAKEAARDAWNRIETAIPGDFDKDGR